jgi:hypothetical protein
MNTTPTDSQTNKDNRNEKMQQYEKLKKVIMNNKNIVEDNNPQTTAILETSEHYSNSDYNEEDREKLQDISNKRKGDDIHDKENNQLRILFQNINSLRPQNLEKWKATIERSTHLKCDIVGLCETGVNWNRKNLTETYQKCLRRTNRNSSLVVSCMKSEFERKSLPGGTATITRGKCHSRVIENITDPSGIGRWSGVKIRVTNTVSLHYITAYRVCNQKITRTNSLSTYTQQATYLQAKGCLVPNPRHQILQDLSEMLSNIPNSDCIINGIDANESIKEKSSKFKKFIEENHLEDIYKLAIQVIIMNSKHI